MGRKKKPLPLLEGVEITGIAAEGKSIARIQWRPDDEGCIVLFVPYGCVGDVADIQIDHKKNKYAEGHIVRMIKPSDIRIKPECRHFGLCGGCKWQHLPYSEQLIWKQKQVTDALERIAKVEIPEISPIIGSGKILAYRNKMEYTFSSKKWRSWEDIKSGVEFTDRPDALGFHIPGAFDKVLQIDECLLQGDYGNQIRQFIYEESGKRNWDFYDIRNNKGLLRTLMIRGTETGEIMVCVSFGENDKERISDVMNAIAERFPDLTSLLYVVNLKCNDTISDQDIKVWHGKEYIEEDMEGLRFRINAKSFYQTNSRQAYELYKVARRFAGLEPGKEIERLPLVYDLYTGTGTIANFVARQASKVIGIEYVEAAIEDARINSEVNGMNNTEFYAGDMKDILTDEFISRHGHPDVMIVDPPRAGMHEDVIKTILNAAPETIVYVSCNPATQARDVAMLDHKYRVTAVQPVDMFPQTHHVENVIKLELR